LKLLVTNSATKRPIALAVSDAKLHFVGRDIDRRNLGWGGMPKVVIQSLKEAVDIDVLQTTRQVKSLVNGCDGNHSVCSPCSVASWFPCLRIAAALERKDGLNKLQRVHHSVIAFTGQRLILFDQMFSEQSGRMLDGIDPTQLDELHHLTSGSSK
jgi:hypothetical protein